MSPQPHRFRSFIEGINSWHSLLKNTASNDLWLASTILLRYVACYTSSLKFNPYTNASAFQTQVIPSARITFSEEDDSHESKEIDTFAIFQQSFEDVAADEVARSAFVTKEDEIDEAETKSNIVVAAEVNNSKKVTEAENDENQVNDVTKNVDSSADAEKEAESNVHELLLQENEPNAGTTFSEEDNIGNTFNTNDSPAVMQPTLPDPVNEQQAENDTPMAVLVLVPEPINEQEEANADQQRNAMEGNAFDDIPVTAPAAIVPEMDLQSSRG
ncbi:hypothetical protein QYM36_000084 [Artemia franciscana]|uniref:Uncharacterized protein n=1 Tax=Artemia franciscana TaxID=6661 RepID=A0AA88I7A4_ARTSF|nr:hypothetical protein QYM36_000084 [Artemia franciscana]